MNFNEALSEQINQLVRKTQIIKGCLETVREENDKLKSLTKKVDLLNSHVELCIGNYKSLHINSDAKECSLEAVSLSAAEKQRKQNNYSAKMKICIKIYLNLNEKLGKELKIVKSQLSRSAEKIDSFKTITSEEFKSMESKIKHYNNDLLKFEKKYPWLTDPKLNLQNISRDVKTLASLREEKNQLLQELSHYRDLKPDIMEATQQLNYVKFEVEQMRMS